MWLSVGKGAMKLQLRQWSERPRILVLMLAIFVPAATLVVLGALHLWSIQRDKAIDAAIQRDYQQFLAIAEKQIDERAYERADADRAKFPHSSRPQDLDAFLTAHPHIAHVFLWAGKDRLVFRSQGGRSSDPQFCAESQMLSTDFRIWWNLDGADYFKKLSKFQKTSPHPVYFMDHWITRGEKMQYQSLVMFLPRGSTPEHPAVAGFLYDTDYLKNNFFPQALKFHGYRVHLSYLPSGCISDQSFDIRATQQFICKARAIIVGGR